ncbi:hypothetical protein BU15DRAFT_50228 [Melanogaster broomeanus]|nr:hypothetical protein BU15DRAFT_50228 [Melanogaster broomeanus]
MSTPTDDGHTESTACKGEHLLSFWAQKFKVTPIEDNRVKWNSDWERGLKSFKTAREVIECFKDQFQDGPNAKDLSTIEELAEMICKPQTVAAESVKQILDLGHLDTIWMLLGLSEQKRHVLQGLEYACKTMSGLGQECRAYCPELTVTHMVSQNGQAFINFITTYHELAQAAQPGKVFHFPSAWWDDVTNDAENPISPKTRWIYDLTTLLRNEFIATFTCGILLSISSDIAHGSKGMNPVVNLMENTDGYFSRAVAKAKANFREKPLIRCENCTKTPEEIGPDTRFMVCSVCRSKLAFTIHYCSPECQKADWKTHKRNCGKKRVSKGLPGTAGDSIWMHKDPFVDFVRELPKNVGASETIRAIGIGPPKYPRSQALQLQVSMLEKDKDADYFIFNAKGEPVRFAIDDAWIKMNFRTTRRTAMSEPGMLGVDAIAEYMIKVMSTSPGLSRDILLDQLAAEYGTDIRQKLVVFEKRTKAQGKGPTFLESYSDNLRKIMPAL